MIRDEKKSLCQNERQRLLEDEDQPLPVERCRVRFCSGFGRTRRPVDRPGHRPDAQVADLDDGAEAQAPGFVLERIIHRNQQCLVMSAHSQKVLTEIKCWAIF